MVKKIIATLTLSSDDGNELSFPLSFNQINGIVTEAVDSEENASLFEALAEHPSGWVRENIASKESINEKTVQILLRDGSMNVIRCLHHNKPFKKYVEHEQILNFIERDVEIAAAVADEYEHYQNLDQDSLLEILLQHSDPRVPYAVAHNWRTKKQVLKKLVKHDDAAVASEAKRRLEDD